MPITPDVRIIVQAGWALNTLIATVQTDIITVGDVGGVARIGILTNNPQATFDVAGNLKATAIQLTTGAGAGKILQSDASGNAVWASGVGTGTVTTISVVGANGLAGTVANATTTPAITLSTSITGVLKGNGTALSAATDGTDYLSATTGVTISQSTPQTIGVTGSRVLKLWVTDITVTNTITGAITGNAGTATLLATPRNIAGVSFNGGSDITIALDNLSDVNAPTPLLDEMLAWNGAAWVNVPPISASASPGIEFYLATPTIIATGTNNANVINTYSKTPIVTAEQSIVTTATTNTVIVGAWLFNTALGRTLIDAGSWEFDFYSGVNSVSGGRVSTVSRASYKVTPALTGTVTTTGSGTSRTATASAGTPFSVANIVASATNTLASYLQTPHGLYQITARTSDTVVTIAVPTTYANESAVTFSVWFQLFNSTSPAITAITPANSFTQWISVQPSYVVAVTDKFGEITFFTSNNTTINTMYYNGSTRNSHTQTPLITLHNNLAGLQGGVANEYYHLTSSEYTGTGTGAFVRANTPTLITPVLGSATATSINKTAFTAPATLSTLTILDGKTLTANNSLTLAGTDGTTMTFPSTSSTVMTLASADTIAGIKSFNDGTLKLTGSASGATTLKAAAAASTYIATLPAATCTLSGIGLAESFTGVKTFSDGSLALSGATSGAQTLKAAAIASTYIATLPAATCTLVGLDTTDTLTNKRITMRIGTVASSATPTINTDNVDVFEITAQAAAITSLTTNLSGTATNDQMMLLRILDNGTARAIAFGTSFENWTVALPTTTVINKWLEILLQYHTSSSKWGCVYTASQL